MKVFSENTYLIMGIKNIVGTLIKLEAYSIYSLNNDDINLNGIVVIDLESWEKENIGKSQSLGDKLTNKKNALIITHTNFQEMMISMLYKETLNLNKFKSFLFFDLLSQGYSYNELVRTLDDKKYLALTERQSQIMSYLITIDCQKTICSKMGIELKTLKCHLQSIMNKFEIRKIANLLTSIQPFRMDLQQKNSRLQKMLNKSI